MPEEKKSEETLAQKIKQAKEQYGEIYESQFGENKFYFRKPSRVEYKRYYDMVLESIYDASYTILLDIIVHPSREAFAACMEKNPAMPIRIVASLSDFFGARTVISKKV